MTIFNAISIMSILGFALCLSAAAVSDARHYKIPNRLPIAIAALWILYIITDRLAPDGGNVPIVWHFLVALVVFLVFFAAFALGRMGGGDVKLIAATALWVGPEGIAPFLILTSVAGLVLTLIISLLRGRLGQPKSPASDTNTETDTDLHPDAADSAREPKAQIPYGIAIAVGGLFVASQLIVNRFA